MENISKHISYNEATTSQTAVRKKIKNIPNEQQLEAMRLVAEKCFEPVREHFGVPLRVSSFFRCLLLNKVIGGANNSQHIKGEAIDIQGSGDVTNKMIFDYIKENLEFDQLINEYNYSWVHVSFSKKGNRNQIVVVK